MILHRRAARVVVALATASLAVPLLMTAEATPRGRAGAPTFREYLSPVGAPGSTGLPIPSSVPRVPFVHHQNGIADACGEPTLGLDHRTGAVLFQCLQQTVKVSGFDTSGPGTSTWRDVTQVVESLQTSDPILYTDAQTGRTFVNQLMFQGCSVQAFTDNDGASWTQSALGCGPGIAFDHQTLGSGPPVQGSVFKTVGYPNLIYYCTNDLAATDCAVSVDGGLSFLPATPVDVSPDNTCTALVGHLKSAADGTIYLMPDGCGNSQAIYTSTNNSLSWTKHPIPGTTEGDAGHPSLAVAQDGTVYAAYGSADAGKGGRVHVDVSRDKGVHWSRDVALGADQGVLQARFPVAVAGDGDRAVVGFLGTGTEGDTNGLDFTGTWRFYLSYTYDRGQTWKTYDATPTRPVQVGPVCTLGTVACLGGGSTTIPVGLSSPTRNLLDFIDLIVDVAGHPVAALAAGCLKAHGCTTADRMSKGLIVRQVGGQGLYRQYDRR